MKIQSEKDIFNLLKCISIGEEFSIHVSSNSMWPLIKVDDQLIVKRFSIKEVEKFDIVVFYSKNLKKIMVHRVVDYLNNDKSIFLSKGDTNLVRDAGFLQEENFLGKATFIKNRKINLIKRNYSWLRFHFPGKSILKIKQKLFHFLYNS